MIKKNIFLNTILISINTFFSLCLFKDSKYVQTFQKIKDYKSALQESPFKIGMMLIYSTGCIHCHRFAPTYKQLAEHFKDKMFFFAMKSGSEYYKEFKVRGYPTIYYYSNGKYTEHKGNRQFEYMEKIINENYLIECKNISIVDIEKIYKDSYIKSIKRNLIIGYFDLKETNNSNNSNKSNINEFEEVTNKLMNHYIDLCFYCTDYKSKNITNDNMIFSYSKQRGNNSFIWEQNKTYNDYENFLYNNVINIYEDISTNDKSYILDGLNEKNILMFIYGKNESLKNNYIEFVNDLYNITQDKKNKLYEYVVLKKGIYDSKLKTVQENELYLISDNFENIKESINISLIKEEIINLNIKQINYKNMSNTSNINSTNITNKIIVNKNNTREMKINQIFGTLQNDDKQSKKTKFPLTIFLSVIIVLIIIICLIKKFCCVGFIKTKDTYCIMVDQGGKIEFN